MVDAEQDVFDAKLEIETGDRPAALARGNRRGRLLRVSRRTQEVPSRNAMRTRASVMVFSRPSIRTVWPRSGSSALKRQVCTAASPVARVVMGVMASARPENVCRERKAKLAAHRRLEQHVELAGAIFA